MLLLLCDLECRTFPDDSPRETSTFPTVDFDLGLRFFFLVLLVDAFEPVKDGSE
jgi:hypothetical protein